MPRPLGEVRHALAAAVHRLADRDTCKDGARELAQLARAADEQEAVAAAVSALASESNARHRNTAAARVAVMRAVACMAEKSSQAQKHMQPHIPKLAGLCAAAAGAPGADAASRAAAVDAIEAMARELPSAWLGPDGGGAGGPLLRPVLALVERRSTSRDDAAALLDAVGRAVRAMQPALRPELAVVRTLAKTQTLPAFAAKGSALLALAACGPASAAHASDALGAPNTAAAAARGGLAGVLRHAQDWRERRAAAEAAEVLVLLARDGLTETRVPAIGGGWSGALEFMAATLTEARSDRVRPVRDAATGALAALARVGVRADTGAEAAAAPPGRRRAAPKAISDEFRRAHAWTEGGDPDIVVMLPKVRGKAKAADEEEEAEEGGAMEAPPAQETDVDTDGHDDVTEADAIERDAPSPSAPIPTQQQPGDAAAPRRKQWGERADAPPASLPGPSSNPSDLAALVATAVSEALRPHMSAIERRLAGLEGRVSELEDTVVDLIEERRSGGDGGGAAASAAAVAVPSPPHQPEVPAGAERPDTPLSRAREVYRDLRALLALAPPQAGAAVLASAADAFDGAARALENPPPPAPGGV